MVLAHLPAAHGDTTTSTSTNPFPVALDSGSYTGNTTLVMTGTGVGSSEVSITVYDPRGAAVTTQNFAVNSSGGFTAHVLIGGPAWTSSGLYDICALVDIPDYTGIPPTSCTTFNYTAVVITTTSTPPPVTTTRPSSSGITLISVLPVLVVIVLAVGVMGYVLSSRGSRTRRDDAKPPATGSAV